MRGTSDPKSWALSLLLLLLLQLSITRTTAFHLPVLTHYEPHQPTCEMDTFTRKTFTTSRGYTWTYYDSGSSSSTLPTLLFQHGWPDHAYMWSEIITHFRSSNITNRIIVPDMLGYDGTSKPTDPSAYAWSGLTNDMRELLASESLSSNIISIGHDWGSAAASRLYNYHPDLIVGLINLNVAYSSPSSSSFSLSAVNEQLSKIFGYPLFEYWNLFASPEGPQILKANVDRLYTMMFDARPHGMRENWCVPHAARTYLTDHSIPLLEVRPFAQNPEFKASFVARMERDSFDAPQQWYVAMASNVQSESDAGLSTEAQRGEVKVPVLFIGADQDDVCRVENIEGPKQMGLLGDLEEYVVKAAHWTPYEVPQEVAGRIADWLKKKGFA